MNKISCEVVQDLIPLYVEKISSTESNQLVETHIQECEECKKFLDEAQQTILHEAKPFEERLVMTERQEAEVFKKIMKKYRKIAMKKIRIVIIVAVIALAVIGEIRWYWSGVYLPVFYEEAVSSTYIKIGERTQNEYFWIEGYAQKMTETWEGTTLVLEGKTSYEYRKELEKADTPCVSWVHITDELERIVYRDGNGDHVLWEKEAD